MEKRNRNLEKAKQVLALCEKLTVQSDKSIAETDNLLHKAKELREESVFCRKLISFLLLAKINQAP